MDHRHDQGTRPGHPPLRAVPSLRPTAPAEPSLGTLRARVAGLVETLCARTGVDGHLRPAAHHGDVALELRDLLPAVEDADLDSHLATIARAAGFISETEAAEPDDLDAYRDAAEEAGFDVADFPARDDLPLPAEQLRAAVIDHWDTELTEAAEALVRAEVAEHRSGAAADAPVRASG